MNSQVKQIDTPQIKAKKEFLKKMTTPIKIIETPKMKATKALINKKMEEQKKLEERNRRIVLLKKKVNERKLIRQSTTILNNPDRFNLYNLLKEQFLGENIIIDYIVPKYTEELLNKIILSDMDDYGILSSWETSNLIRTIKVKIPQTMKSFRKLWKNELVFSFMWDSENDIFDFFKRLDNSENIGKIIIRQTKSDLTSERIRQAFADGISHCLFSHINNWATECYNNAISKKSKERYTTIINKVKKYTLKYINGIPEEDLSIISNDLCINIIIEMPLMDKKLLEINCEKKALKTFRYMNTRINHVDLLNNNLLKNNSTNITIQELEQIKSKLDKNNEFYIFKRSNNIISTIYTSDTIYKTNSIYNEVANEFENQYNFKQYILDDIKDYNLSKFIRHSVHYNSTVDFKNTTQLKQNKDYTNITHIDMEKAYTQFKKSKFYQGFLGKIHDFRKVNNHNQMGIYYVSNFNFTNANPALIKLNKELQIYIKDNNYTKPELDFLKSQGVDFKVEFGAFGTSFDFDFSQEMINNKDNNGVSYFAKWTGMCNSRNKERNFFMKGDKKLAKIMKFNCEFEEIRYYDNDEIEISYDNEYQPHLSHITSFITSYQRLNVLEQLLNMDLSKLIRICVDGIYTYEENPKLYNAFRRKNEYNFQNQEDDCYCSNIYSEPREYRYANYREYYSKELWIGEGGNGKTHTNLIDNGLIKPLYVAPSYKICRDKSSEYGCKTMVLANVISKDIEKQNIIKNNFNCIILDEVSMMSNKIKEIIFSLYPNIRMIFCGDLCYQLPPISETDELVEEMDKTGFDTVINKNDKNYRYIQNNKIIYITTALRNFIENNTPYQQVRNWLLNEFKSFGQLINKSTLEEMYKIQDFILCRTNIKKDIYTKLFTSKFGEHEKYYITENTLNYSNGDIIIDNKKPDVNNEIRHAFTTHSVQGITLDLDKKLFIDINNMYDSRYEDTNFMTRILYTAISRAKSLEQIYIII